MKHQKVFAWHSYTGLIAGIFILAVSLSGALLAFHDELDDLLHAPVIHSGSFYPEKPSLDRAFKNVYQHYPDYEIRVYRLEKSSPHRAFYFDVRSKTHKLKLFVHPISGEILKKIPHRSFLSTWLLELHYTLFIGKWGRLLMFFVSFALLVLFISGLLIYRKRLFRSGFRNIRFQNKNPRVFWSSVHGVFGSWLSLLALLPVVTGIVLSYQKVQSAFSSKKTLVPTIEKKTVFPSSIDQIQRYIAKEFKDFQPTFLRLAARSDELAFGGWYREDFFLWGNRSNWIYFDLYTGGLKRVKRIRAENLWQRLNRINHTLHMAEYGNAGVKFLYSISAFGLGMLSLTGFYLYFNRRKRAFHKKF